MTRLKFRSLFLYAIAAVIFGEAAIGLFRPHAAAEAMGYAIVNADGMSEFRAVYLGMWCALGGAALLAARRPEEPLLGNFVACAILGEAFARILSVAIDGPPGLLSYVHIAMELSPLALLLARPTALAKGSPA